MPAAMPVWRPALLAAALSFAAVTAQASDASDVAERGGFLLGQAYRCGVAAQDLQPSANLIHKLSDALAADESEKTDADKVFAERFVVSAAADSLGDLLPSCAAIKSALAQLERHNPDAVLTGSSSPPGATSARPTAHRAAKPRRPGSGKAAGSMLHRRVASGNNRGRRS